MADALSFNTYLTQAIINGNYKGAVGCTLDTSNRVANREILNMPIPTDVNTVYIQFGQFSDYFVITKTLSPCGYLMYANHVLNALGTSGSMRAIYGQIKNNHCIMSLYDFTPEEVYIILSGQTNLSCIAFLFSELS